MRYDLRALFVTGSFLRPPHVESDLPDHTSTPHMWGGEDLVIPTVIAGGWRAKEGKTHLFVCNIRDEVGKAKISLRATEYGVTEKIPEALLPYAPILDKESDTLTLSLSLIGQEALHIEF